MKRSVFILFMFLTNAFGMLSEDSSEPQLMPKKTEVNMKENSKKEIFKNGSRLD